MNEAKLVEWIDLLTIYFLEKNKKIETLTEVSHTIASATHMVERSLLYFLLWFNKTLPVIAIDYSCLSPGLSFKVPHIPIGLTQYKYVPALDSLHYTLYIQHVSLMNEELEETKLSV